MKKNEIQAGKKYIAKVNGGETVVLVLSTGLGGLGRRQTTTYKVKNLRTGRETLFRSAAKFRAEATDEQVIGSSVKIVVPQTLAQSQPKETNVPTPKNRAPKSKTQAQPETFPLVEKTEERKTPPAMVIEMGPVEDVTKTMKGPDDPVEAPQPVLVKKTNPTPKKLPTTEPILTDEDKKVIADRRTKSEFSPKVMSVLNEWADYAGALGKTDAEARKYFSRRRRLEHVPAGSKYVSFDTGETGTVVEQFQGNATKVIVDGSAKPMTKAPGTAVEIIPADEVQVVKAPAAPTANGTTAPSTPREVKPRSGGLFGHAATAILRWMGSQKWTKDEAIKTLKAKGIEVAEGTAGIQLKAGEKGGDCGGRGPIPTLKDEEVEELNVAAGKVAPKVEAPAPKKTPTPKKAK